MLPCPCPRRLRPFQLCSVLALSVLSCAFTWPGRASHWLYLAAHGDPPQRAAALRQLSEFPSESTLRAQLLALEDPDEHVRAQAAASLGRARAQSAVPALLEWLKSRDPSVRVRALRALGDIAAQETLPKLQRALADEDANVRVAAVESLTRASVGEPERAPALSTALLPLAEDREALVRAAALTALGELAPLPPTSKDPRVAAWLTHSRDAESSVRELSLRALGQVRDARVLPALSRGVSDRDTNVSLAALAALGDTGLPGAVAALRGALTRPPDAPSLQAARTAIAALGRIDHRSAEAALAETLARREWAQASAEALVTRARRLQDLQERRRAYDIATARLSRSSEPVIVDACARVLIQLAALMPEPERRGPTIAVPALQRGVGNPVLLTQAALVTGEPQLISTLLAHLPERGTSSPWFDALELALYTATEKAVPPASTEEVRAAASTLAPRLSRAQSSAERVRLLRLLARTHPKAETDYRPTPNADGAERRAFAEYLGSLPAEAETQQQLLTLLDDMDPPVRQQAADALARNADAPALRQLTDRLARSGFAFEGSALRAIAGALLQLKGGSELPAPLREQLFQQLAGERLFANDAALAASALVALRSSTDPRAPETVAQLLRDGSPQRRASSVLALGDYHLAEARRMLRYVLNNERPHLAVNAALALAEVGNEQDARALTLAAERGAWPLPAAVSFALARIAQRGVLKRHTLAQMLCRLGRKPDAYVRANVATGLAALSFAECGHAVNPQAWLTPEEPSVQRVAAAHWAAALTDLDPSQEEARAQLLARCAADLDPNVARACSNHPHAEPTPRVRVLVDARDSAGVTPLADQKLALRLPDGAVFIATSDVNAQLVAPDAPQGPLILEDAAADSVTPPTAAVAVPASNPGLPPENRQPTSW